MNRLRRALVVPLLVLVAACQAAPVPSASPSPVPSGSPSSPGPSASPSDAPSPSPDPTATPEPEPSPLPSLDADGFAVTISPDVRVRSLPEVSDASDRLEPLLPLGARLFVVRGPVSADGFAWYLVDPLREGLPSGWVATGRVDDPWVEAEALVCPRVPRTFGEIAELTADEPYTAMLCLGADEVALDGLLGGWEAQCGLEPCCVVDSPWSCLSDAWLADRGADPEQDALLAVYLDPEIDVEDLPPFSWQEPVPVRASIRFDHPLAGDCRATDDDSETAHALAVLTCRAQPVVLGIQVGG